MVLRKGFFAVFFLFSFTCLFLVSIVSAHGDEEHDELPSKVNVCHSLSESEKNNCYTALCEGEVTNECTEDIISAAVSGSGPKFALAVAVDLLSVSLFSSFDGYRLAQKVGRLTARQYGLSGDVFSRCSKDFHYGCYYGFFEEVTAQEGFTPLKAAVSICDSLPDSEKEMCYHKMGHMFMKQGEYNLQPVLSLCDALPAAVMHCWDGVFMEGVNEVLQNSTLLNGFSKTHILAPCNAVDDIYRKVCYQNHGRYLLKYSDTPSAALEACARAGNYISVCRDSVRNVSSGAKHHHAQGENDMSAGKTESWFQKIINFILALFRDSDSEKMKDGHQDAMRGDSVVHMREELSANEESVPAIGGGGNTVVIVYRDNEYIPDTVYISVGDTVTWVNESSVFWPASNLHPTHKNYPGSNITKCGTPERITLFDACKAMGPGAKYSFTFNEEGEWNFHDHINPRSRGTVIVSE